MFAALEPGEIPFVADDKVEDDADGVFFDAGIGPTTELNNRCEAGWRYNAADREVLCELRRTTTDIKACRKHERKRGDEALERLTSSQRSFRKEMTPIEERIYGLKEALTNEIEATRFVLEANIKQKMALRVVQEELQETQKEQCCYDLGAKKLENSLKVRNWEVQEQVERLKSELCSLEESTERLAEDNERCRRLLHAARFETETERFVPKAALQRAAALEAAKQEEKARRDAEAAKLAEGAPPPAPPLEFRKA